MVRSGDENISEIGKLEKTKFGVDCCNGPETWDPKICRARQHKLCEIKPRTRCLLGDEVLLQARPTLSAICSLLMEVCRRSESLLTTVAHLLGSSPPHSHQSSGFAFTLHPKFKLATVLASLGNYTRSHCYLHLLTFRYVESGV